MGYDTIRLDPDAIQMHPKSAPSISLETNILDYQWKGQILQTFSKRELMESLEVLELKKMTSSASQEKALTTI